MRLKKDLPEVHLIRGLASLLVCLFHLTLGNGELFPRTSMISRFFSSGYLGVELFFILSGYVICYSFPENFNTENVKTFFLKRVTRIEPPYIISILLVVLLNALSYSVTGKEDHLNWLNLAGHLAYLNNFAIGSYVNVVYWTLGIEFQFYLLIGLFFPYMRTSKTVLCLILATFMLLSFLTAPSGYFLIYPYLSYFGIGVLLFFYRFRNEFGASVFVIGCLLLLTQIYLSHGIAAATATVVAIAILLSWKFSNKVIRFFSLISYSLYLTHVPVGGKVINLGVRYFHGVFAHYVLLLAAFIVCIGFGYAFYYCVERPFVKLSKRIAYKQSTVYKAPEFAVRGAKNRMEV